MKKIILLLFVLLVTSSGLLLSQNIPHEVRGVYLFNGVPQAFQTVGVFFISPWGNIDQRMGFTNLAGEFTINYNGQDYHPADFPWLQPFCPLRGGGSIVVNTGHNVIYANLNLFSISLPDPDPWLPPPTDPGHN